MQSQRGEIATIITALAVVILTIGVALGVTQLKAPQKQSTQSRAQTPQSEAPNDSPAAPPQGSCTYQSYTHVYKEENPIFFSPTEIGQMKVVNDRGGALILDQNDRSQRHYVNGEFPFDPTRKVNYAENDPATLTLEGYDRSAWKVKSVFCTNRGVNGCPDQSAIDALNQRIASGSDDGSRLEGFRVNCGVDVTYGWVLTNSPSTISPAPTAVPTVTPTPEPTATPEPTIASCPYTSTSHVYKGTKGTPLPLSELDGTVLTVTNDRSNTLLLNQQGLSTNSFTIDPMPFDPTGASYYPKGASASVTLGKLPSNYKVKSIFCDQAPGSSQGCPLPDDLARINTAIAGGADGLKIDNFKIDCNVNTTYGWIVEPQTSGVGSMEVRVEALNYPEKTSIWDKDDNASNKPGSCSRNQPSDQRPLYLSPFKIKATCVSGPCKGNKSITLKIDKRVGYANFQGITPGDYKLKMVDFDDRGYEMWEPCGDVVWKVESGKTNQLPVVFLANLKDGQYEEQPTESACKEVNGYPNLVEGLSGNVCYYKDGKKDDPKPEPKDGCEALEDGSNGVCVIIENQDLNTKLVPGIFLNPLPGLDEKSIVFNGAFKREVRRIQVGDNTQARQVIVHNIEMLNGALSSQVRVVACDGPITEDKAGGISKGSQICHTNPSPTTRIHYKLVPHNTEPDKPDPTPTPTPKPPVKPKVLYTIPLRMTDVNLHSDYIARIKKMRPFSMPYAKKIHDEAIKKNWNPALLLAIWLEETGGSTTTIKQAGGAGRGSSTEHLGCRPRTIQNIDVNLECFFGPPRTNLKNDEYEKFAAGYCGPNQPVLCGNNPYFLATLAHVYDSLVPLGTRGARQILPTFSGDETAISENWMYMNHALMNDFISSASDLIDMVTIRDTDSYSFGYSKSDRFFYLQLNNSEVNSTEILKNDLLPRLKLSQSEACQQDMYIYSKEGDPEFGKKGQTGYIQDLSFCSSPTQQDLNDDSEVNGVDFGQCIADYETSDEAERAFDQLTKREVVKLSTGQSLESLYELDLPCDFNVSRRIDALDLSKMLEAIKTSAESQK